MLSFVVCLSCVHVTISYCYCHEPRVVHGLGWVGLGHTKWTHGQLCMNHIVDTCPLTEFEGGLNQLHEADDDAVIWLETTATAALAK